MINEEALSFIEEVEQENNPQELVERFAVFVGRLGFSAYIISGLPAVGANVEPLIIATNWPKRWLDLYREKQFFLSDPIARTAVTSRRTFKWNDAITAHPGPAAEEFIRQAAEHNFTDGILIPLHSATKWKVVASLAADGPVTMTAAQVAHLETAVVYFYRRYEDLTDGIGSRISLSPREGEVLRLCAAGKSAWEIGKIIGISEATVVVHRKSSIRKLGCTNTTHAVVVAIEAGLLQS